MSKKELWEKWVFKIELEKNVLNKDQ